MSKPFVNIFDRPLGGKGSRWVVDGLIQKRERWNCLVLGSHVNIYVCTTTNLSSFPTRSGTDSNVSMSAFAYLYSELVQYHQNRVDSISELERRLESSGYGIGLKTLELQSYRSKEVRTLGGVEFLQWCDFKILKFSLLVSSTLTVQKRNKVDEYSSICIDTNLEIPLWKACGFIRTEYW